VSACKASAPVNRRTSVSVTLAGRQWIVQSTAAVTITAHV